MSSTLVENYRPPRPKWITVASMLLQCFFPENHCPQRCGEPSSLMLAENHCPRRPTLNQNCFNVCGEPLSSTLRRTIVLNACGEPLSSTPHLESKIASMFAENHCPQRCGEPLSSTLAENHCPRRPTLGPTFFQ